MARFYVGQPVVAIYTREEWIAGSVIAAPPLSWLVDTPAKGKTYIVSGYRSLNHIFISGMSVSILGDVSYLEDGFRPLTDRQVKEIIEAAIKPPATKRELVELLVQ